LAYNGKPKKSLFQSKVDEIPFATNFRILLSQGAAKKLFRISTSKQEVWYSIQLCSFQDYFTSPSLGVGKSDKDGRL